jgi:hypothetical protein
MPSAMFLCTTAMGICVYYWFTLARSERAAPKKTEGAWKWPGSAMQTWNKYVSLNRMESRYIPLSWRASSEDATSFIVTVKEGGA